MTADVVSKGQFGRNVKVLVLFWLLPFNVFVLSLFFQFLVPFFPYKRIFVKMCDIDDTFKLQEMSSSHCTCCGRDLNTNVWSVDYNRNAAKTTKWRPIIGQWAPKWRHRWAIWIVPVTTYHHALTEHGCSGQFHSIPCHSNLGLLPAINDARRREEGIRVLIKVQSILDLDYNINFVHECKKTLNFGTATE